MRSRRTVLAGAALLPFAAPPVALAQQDITFFRILTGGTVGTYFPIGGLIANAISNPPGSRPCNDGGSGGVPGLVATSVASNGSVANAAAVRAGPGQAGLRQSDLPLWAEYLAAQQVADKMKEGAIDAFFSVSGWPQSAVADLAATIGIDLVPIAGPQADKLIQQYNFFGADEIPDDAYKNVTGVKTVS